MVELNVMGPVKVLPEQCHQHFSKHRLTYVRTKGCANLSIETRMADSESYTVHTFQ